MAGRRARGPAKCASNYTALLLTNNLLAGTNRSLIFSYHIHYGWPTLNALLYDMIFYYLNVN